MPGVADREHLVVAPQVGRPRRDLIPGHTTGLFLRADKAVPYGEMMDVLEILRAGGYSKIKLVALEGIANAPPQASAPSEPKP